MATASHIELIPLGPECQSHHLIQASGLCFRKEVISENELIETLQASEKNYAVTTDIFRILPFEHEFWEKSLKKQSLRILFDANEILNSESALRNSLEKNFYVLVLFHRKLDSILVQRLESLFNDHSNFSFVFLESHLSDLDLDVSALPNLILKNLYFCFLPKRSHFDAFLKMPLVLERIEAYKANMSATSNDFRIFSLSSKHLPSTGFYLNPSREEYLALSQISQKNLFSFAKFLNRIHFLKFIDWLQNVGFLLRERGFFNTIFYAFSGWASKMIFHFKIIFHGPLFYPFKKIYWFSEYQYRKRISKK